MISLFNLAYRRIIELVINNYFKYNVKYNTLRDFSDKNDVEYITTCIANT